MVLRPWRLVFATGSKLRFFTYTQLMDKVNSHTLPLGTYRIEHWEAKRWYFLSTYEHRL